MIETHTLLLLICGVVLLCLLVSLLLMFKVLGLARDINDISNEARRLQGEMAAAATQNTALHSQLGQSFAHQLESMKSALHNMHQLMESKLHHFNVFLEDRMFRMQADNTNKLEQIRHTVSEKLQETLEARLGETFKMVSERLEQVHRGIGEMQNLATGVGDLKKILTNVKTRGVWGEIQLEAILEQMMSPQQYEKNAAVEPGSQDRVEFAVKLPAKDSDGIVLLPMDAKCPLDVYQKLLAAQDAAILDEVDVCYKELEATIKRQGKLIAQKYIRPPHTTDFAIMFLPIEGLYAEVLRIPGLAEFLQHTLKIVITGPTTLSAILSSLQMGYRAVAIQKRSHEVWNLLAVIRREFVKFADLLSKTKLKLEQASKVIGDAENKTKTIERKLKHIELDSLAHEPEQDELLECVVDANELLRKN